jgi:hypothetical protein
MPRLRSIDTMEYMFLLAAISAAAVAQFPAVGFALQHVLANLVETLGEPERPGPAPGSLARVESPYGVAAPPGGKPVAIPILGIPAETSNCASDSRLLGPARPRDWWRPLLPEADPRVLEGRLLSIWRELANPSH